MLHSELHGETGPEMDYVAAYLSHAEKLAKLREHEDAMRRAIERLATTRPTLTIRTHGFGCRLSSIHLKQGTQRT